MSNCVGKFSGSERRYIRIAFVFLFDLDRRWLEIRTLSANALTISPRDGKPARAQINVNDRCPRPRLWAVRVLGGGGGPPCCASCHPLFKSTQETGPPIVMQCNAMRRVRRLLFLLNQTRADRNVSSGMSGSFHDKPSNRGTSRPQKQGLIGPTRPVRHVRDCARWRVSSHFISSPARLGETVRARKVVRPLIHVFKH